MGKLKQYKVTIHEHIIYDAFITASDEAEAEELAETQILDEDTAAWREDRNAGWTELGDIELLDESAPNRNEQRAGFLEKKYGAKDWYDWCNMNWGTKWNSSDAECKLMEYGDTSVAQFTFATAWAPPIPVIEELAKQFPNTNIYISYDEPGMSFSGYFYYADGELSSQQEFDQSYSYLQMLMEPTVDVFEYVN